MKYLNDIFWDIPQRLRHENIVYVLLLTLCLIYFPKGLLPKELLTASENSFQLPIFNKKQAFAISSSQFNIPFIGCYTRYTGSISTHNASLYSKHFWINGCNSYINFDYQLVREKTGFKLYSHQPFLGRVKQTNELHESLVEDTSFVFYRLFPNLGRK
jgi:hypothetical protein